MKQGSTDDPFAEPADDSTDETPDPSPDPDPVDTSPTDQSSGDTGQSIPWLFKRENARDGREKTKQLHLQAETERKEGSFKSAVERRVDESVQLTDLREAALLVAMEHPDEVATQLREWGYDFE